jgi:excreted virulence factor EspC (type VII ESX diderm)
MTMSFQVVSDELRAHASHLDGLTDRLNTAVSAAGQVTMDTEAYGVLCAFLPPIINAVTEQHATDTLHAAVQGMTDTANNVRTAASSYDDAEQSNAAPWKAQLSADGSSTGGTPTLPNGAQPRIGTTIGVTASPSDVQPRIGVTEMGGGPGIELSPTEGGVQPRIGVTDTPANAGTPMANLPNDVQPRIGVTQLQPLQAETRPFNDTTLVDGTSTP